MLVVLASFAEILSIGAVLPFLAVLTSPGPVFEHPAARPLIEALGATQPQQLLLPLTVIFGLAVLAAGAIRLLLLWASTRLAFATGADLSSAIYQRTLWQPYAVHVARNSSEVIDGISVKVWNVIYAVLLPSLTLVSATIMLVALLSAFLSAFPVIALTALGGFALIYLVVIRLTQRRLVANSRQIADASTQVIKSLQEGLGGIRDVLIDGSQATYCEIYRAADRPLRRAQGANYFMIVSPRFGVEALGMVLIAALAYGLAQQSDGLAGAIPVLGALALGAQRMLPVLQQGYESWSNMRGGQASLQDILELLDQELPDGVNGPIVAPLPFGREIKLKQLSFRYGPQAPWVLRGVDLTIAKGSRVGFIGSTGTGKSTLLDIAMGLLQPTEGALEIDGRPVTSANNRAWQAHIAHVPQAIYLADTSIEENIAFGVPRPQIDFERVRHAARQAQIAELIEQWPDQYRSLVGERGVRLSGGQRQRIGIARALYRQADVIIFDEATSALDDTTEQAIMEAINALPGELTILMIAHRVSTLKNCDQVVELGKGGVITRTGSYGDMLGHPA
ncbi:MAG: ABC transporter ATP-binding protein/permease [Steroidobacteraceae bacterium]|nr:ABC transporter ATP-binding protein/permease [Steroidobacteraceae bacterium]